MSNHPMRRHKRQIHDRQHLAAILNACEYGHLALCDGNEPYVVALNYTWVEENGRDVFFFHSAPAGRKIDCLRANPRGCFMVETGVKLIVPTPPDNCLWTTHFQSVVACGNISIISDQAEQEAALKVFMRRFAPDVADFAYPPHLIGKMVMLKMIVDDLKGKQLPTPPTTL